MQTVILIIALVLCSFLSKTLSDEEEKIKELSSLLNHWKIAEMNREFEVAKKNNLLMQMPAISKLPVVPTIKNYNEIECYKNFILFYKENLRKIEIDGDKKVIKKLKEIIKKEEKKLNICIKKYDKFQKIYPREPQLALMGTESKLKEYESNK